MLAIQGSFDIDENNNLYYDQERWEREFEEIAKAERENQLKQERALARLRQAQTERYYNAVNKLLDDVASYLKLLGLAEVVLEKNNPAEWTPQIREVMEKYWHGDCGRVRRAITEKRQNCKNDIIILNMVCRRVGVEQVKDPDGLLEKLLDSHRLKAYRRYMKSYADRAIALNDFEVMYLMNNPKARS